MSNNSGLQRTVINTRERAVSTDINLLQSRGNRDYMTAHRRLFNDTYPDDGTSGIGESKRSSVGDSTDGLDVIGGLELEIFSTHLLIKEGVVGASATPGAFETGKDSDYVFVNDPGVTSASVLTFTSNGNGVDIVECQVIDTIFTTESRDIYDPLTGLFTAALVTKSAGAQLSYRIRQSGAFPGTAVGWFPLYVAVQKTGASNFNDVDFYDVRPIVHERNYGLARAEFNSLFSLSPEIMWSVRNNRLHGRFYDPNGVGGALLDSNSTGYILRGKIAETMPGVVNGNDSEEDGIDLDNADYYAPGVSATPGINRWLYVISVFPESLPRWVRYKDSSAGTRRLSFNRGLLVIVDRNVASFDSEGTATGFNLPSEYQLGSTNVTGRIVAAVFQKSDNSFMEVYCAQDGWIFTPENDFIVGPVGAESNPSGSILRWEFDVSGPGDSDANLPVGAVSALVELPLGYTNVGVSRVESEITTSVSTGGSIALMGRRRQSYGQVPIGTDDTFRITTRFDWPSESMVNTGAASGNFATVIFNAELEFTDTTVSHDTTTDSVIFLGHQVEWA